ncbi:XRE family transcriptional regulator [Wolbachia endosymbiont of Atemnus politus]|uniref:helix-turn-helix domain-containing protein n=1 Tax=Wolbachia endosymbiont of Atemnus politus TaxID=2682840 RepID=UPI0015721B2F|nr:helix-turn-helix transcriptional regulator [Wolbachia endosymbiont of Atemnus politus]NSM56712.1 XRE family transcriptional regulator [Wolbachia endosymbiont of Atemnus politus]
MEIISLNNNSCNVEIKKKLLDIISKVIEKNAWTQAHAAERLGVDQPKISQIKNGKTDGFSLERLLGFLKKFDHEITITITENRAVKPEVEKAKHEVRSK